MKGPCDLDALVPMIVPRLEFQYVFQGRGGGGAVVGVSRGEMVSLC